MTQNKSIIGHGGGGSAPAPYVPVEEDNTLQANTYANIVDLIAEGEIGGPANDNNWYKSTYLNEIPVQNPSSMVESYNYNGIVIVGNNGTETQESLPGFSPIEVEEVVDTQVTLTGGPVTRTITDSNVNNVKVTISLPALISQENNGDKKRTTLQLRISITPDNGAGDKQVVISEDTSGKIYGKCISEYREQFTITNLQQYGSAPWVITVERITPDSDTVNLINSFKWYSYTTQIDTKLRYYDRAVVGLTINSSQFGNSLPTRAYKINGRKIKVPSNYNVETRGYTGDWDGEFILGSSNNPAWVIYDLLTDPVIGLGDIIKEDMVDKWGLYSCGSYCDQSVSFSTMTINTSGSHSSSTGTEPRFSFNGVIETRAQALEVITHLCSVMRAYPIWTGGMLKFIQDRPILTPARPVGLSNISPDGFEYEGISKRDKHTVVRASWNNPENFGKLDTLELVDENAIREFGYNELDFAAFGCTSRTEAIRRAKFILDTDINSREVVKFAGSMEFSDCVPGDLLAIQDEYYAGKSLEGRVISSTTTSLKLDRQIVFESGNTYTALISQPNSNAIERQLTNSAGTTDTLTWTSALPAAPQYEGMVIISSTNLSTRKFVVISISEVDEYFNIVAIEYDSNKYDRIETGVVGEMPPPTTLLSSILIPPTNISVEGFTYTESDQDIRKFGIQIGWTLSVDPRTDSYELRYKPSDGAWRYLGSTRENSFDWRDTKGDTYDIGVRGKGAGMVSEWLTYTDFTMDDELTGLAPPTNLDTIDGDGIWSGADCTIKWDPSTGSEYNDSTVGTSNIGYYKVEVRKPDTTLIRAFNTASKFDTTYTYTYQDNVNDNTTPLRTLLFFVYTVDVFDNPSEQYASLSASNPAPDMSSVVPTLESKFGYLKASWIISADKDISHYKVYVDTDDTPTTVHSIVNHPTNTLDINGLSADIDYFCQVEPYDLFGAGIKSLVSNAESIYQIPSINVDIELSESIIRTDSDDNTTETMEKLYNGALSTDGISYTVSGTDKWIQYKYGIEDYFDRIGLWTGDANGKIYIAYSTDGENWTYLKAEADHTLDGDDMLLIASSQEDAATNYFQLISGKNYALFPNNLTAKYIRLYLTGSYTTTIYEFIPSRILISELAAIGHLSSYSANIGLIVSGRLQNDDGTTYFDLDDNRLKLGTKFDYDDGDLSINGTITVGTGSTGYTNLDDKPTTLNTINPTEYNTLSTASTNSTTAVNLLSDISNDDKLTAVEKQQTKIQVDAIVGEKSGINSLASSMSITTENTNYNTYYTTLINYLTPLLSNLTTTSDINGNTFRTNFTNFYNYRQILLNKISGVGGTAMGLLDDISNDNKLTASEKQQTKIQVDAIKGEKSGINTLAANLAITTENTNYNTYYTTLIDYIDPLLSNLTTTSDITGTTFRTNFTNFYNYRQILLNKIASFTGGIKYTSQPTPPYRLGDLWQNSTSIYRCTTERLTGSYTASDWTVAATNDTPLYVVGTTQIDGGKIHASSNVVIGNTTNGSYCSISAGDISFYRYLAGSHRNMKSLKRIESGVANSGVVTTLPGYWESQPKIMVSQYQLASYNKAYPLQNQTTRISADNIVETSAGSAQYKFTPTAQLILSDAAIGYNIGTYATGQVIRDSGYPSFSVYSPQYALGIANIKQVNAVVSGQGVEYYPGTGAGTYHQYFAIYISARLEYFNGAWQNMTGAFTPLQLSYNSPITWNLSTPTSSTDITHIRMVVKWTWTSTVTGVQLSYGQLHPEGEYPIERLTAGLVSYTSNLPGFTIVQTGSLNWIAIG